jgi:hypothetical protein
METELLEEDAPHVRPGGFIPGYGLGILGQTEPRAHLKAFK